MSPIKAFVCPACLTLTFLAVLGTQAHAQNSTPRFYQTVAVPGVTPSPVPGLEYAVTFSGPFAIPGVALPGGTYLFRVLIANIVQVLGGDRAQVYAMVMTTPARRDKVTGRDVVFGTARADTPRPIKTWFPPGSAVGHELFYPNRAAGKTDERPSN